ncbi:MAG: hypothetical protein IJI83_03260 [Oscillospiraceae bacterium]|nr:hypothetical protein [Oscillospiraceae bacterium]
MVLSIALIMLIAAVLVLAYVTLITRLICLYQKIGLIDPRYIFVDKGLNVDDIMLESARMWALILTVILIIVIVLRVRKYLKG